MIIIMQQNHVCGLYTCTCTILFCNHACMHRDISVGLETNQPPLTTSYCSLPLVRSIQCAVLNLYYCRTNMDD